MTPIKPIMMRHPVSSYIVLTFAISWVIVLLAIGGPSGIPGTTEQLQRLLPVVIVAMLTGPSIAGLVMTGLVHGRAGFRDLLARLRTWRVSVCWYAVALLTAPLVHTVVLLALSRIDPVFVPGILTASDKITPVLFGIGAALLVGLCEELGWTGFAVPQLRLHHGIVATGLIVGVIWGAWHILTNDLWASGTSAGELPLALFAIITGLGFLVGQLPAYRVLMVWVYDHTNSLLLAVLMHASLTAATLIFGPAAISGVALLTYALALAVVQWGIVAVVAVASSGHLARQPLPLRTA